MFKKTEIGGLFKGTRPILFFFFKKGSYIRDGDEGALWSQGDEIFMYLGEKKINFTWLECNALYESPKLNKANKYTHSTAADMGIPKPFLIYKKLYLPNVQKISIFLTEWGTMTPGLMNYNTRRADHFLGPL